MELGATSTGRTAVGPQGPGAELARSRCRADHVSYFPAAVLGMAAGRCPAQARSTVTHMSVIASRHPGGGLVVSPGRHRLSRRRRGHLFGLALVAPTLLLYGLFIVWPVIRGAIVSLYQWDGLSTV